MSVAGFRASTVRKTMLPYGHQCVTEEDIRLVVEVLEGDWLTTGPMIERFEQSFAHKVGAAEAVAVSSGTAALHAAMFAVNVGPGDEVIVPAMTFAATANAVVFQGATPVFADVDPDTLLVDPSDVQRQITPRTRAIVGVDYAGQPCDYSVLSTLAQSAGASLVADASHSLGAAANGRPVGGLAELSTFSMHPVKPITTGEGGMVATDNADMAERMRRFRNHGITQDHHQRKAAGSWHYEMTELGYNYRLTDIQAALGLGQLAKLDAWTDRRNQIAARYDHALKELPGVERLRVQPGLRHAWHLYVIRLDEDVLEVDRRTVFDSLRREHIGVAVHYLPVHLHPFYRRRFQTGPGMCPNAEAAYERILSLPIFPAMSDGDVDDVIRALERTIGRPGR